MKTGEDVLIVARAAGVPHATSTDLIRAKLVVAKHPPNPDYVYAALATEEETALFRGKLEIPLRGIEGVHWCRGTLGSPAADALITAYALMQNA